MATNTLGEIFSAKQSDTHRKYPAAWLNWLERRNDRHAQIRMHWLDWALRLYKN